MWRRIVWERSWESRFIANATIAIGPSLPRNGNSGAKISAPSVKQFTLGHQNAAENISQPCRNRPAAYRDRKGGFMNDFSTEKAVALNGEMTVVRTFPLDRAKAISDLIAEQALASERMGRLTDKVATALLDANLFSVLVPEAEGGLGGTGVGLFEATEEIARADGSAGWCMAISNAISGFVCKGASAEAREEVFGNGPVACWATLLPKATSVGVK